MKPILFLFALLATATAASLKAEDPVDTEIEKETTDELPKVCIDELSTPFMTE
jgi:hypothetical protein